MIKIMDSRRCRLKALILWKFIAHDEAQTFIAEDGDTHFLRSNSDSMLGEILLSITRSERQRS